MSQTLVEEPDLGGCLPALPAPATAGFAAPGLGLGGCLLAGARGRGFLAPGSELDLLSPEVDLLMPGLETGLEREEAVLAVLHSQ